MQKLNNKQQHQAANIMDTLLEATEHFSWLLKQKEFNQTIYILSSIVEGFNAISGLLEASDTLTEQKFKEKISVIYYSNWKKGISRKWRRLISSP